MKKIFNLMIVFMLIAAPARAADEWRNATGANTLLGTTLINDIDARSYGDIVAPLDRLLAGYREGMVIKFNTVAQLTVSAGEITCSNSAETVRKFRRNTSATTVTWSDIDTGGESSGTDYYVYAVCDADAATATFTMSTSATTPSGKTYYKRLGSFTNDGSSNITVITNDNERIVASSGTVSNGGTISLPSGYDSSECNWTVGGNSQIQTDGNGESSTGLTVTVSAARVATCSSASSASLSTYGSTCSTNYIIVCYR